MCVAANPRNNHFLISAFFLRRDDLGSRQLIHTVIFATSRLHSSRLWLSHFDQRCGELWVEQKTARTPKA